MDDEIWNLQTYGDGPVKVPKKYVDELNTILSTWKMPVTAFRSDEGFLAIDQWGTADEINRCIDRWSKSGSFKTERERDQVAIFGIFQAWIHLDRVLCVSCAKVDRDLEGR